jgi:hypothetical protein
VICCCFRRISGRDADIPGLVLLTEADIGAARGERGSGIEGEKL